MDLQLVNKGLEFTRKKKKWLILLAVFGVSGYGAYKVYNLPSIVRKRKRVLKLLSSLFTIADVLAGSAETIGILSGDLKVFLQSDCDEIPNSLKQFSKLFKSEEFSDSVVRITAAFTRGVFRGYQEESKVGGDGGNEANLVFYDRFMDKLFSDAGSGFVSVVVGSFAKNLVTGLYNGGESESGLNNDCPVWVDVMCSERGRDLIGECIQKFVSTAVAVYLDKTMDVNTYDELFAGLTNPKHEKQVRDALVALCNGSIETLVKTSHQVLTLSSPSTSAELGSGSGNPCSFVVSRSNSDVVSKTFYSEIDDARNVITVKQNGQGWFTSSEESKRSSSSSSSGGGWVSTLSSTLAVPSNRKLVLDVTGRVTFETVRSFLQFLLEKLFGSVKRSSRTVNETIIDTGHEVVRYATAKSLVVASICLSLCLHILGGPWAFIPALHREPLPY